MNPTSWPIGSHWILDLGAKGRHEVVIETRCTGSCDCVIMMAHPKPGQAEHQPEDWDWANVLRVHRKRLKPMQQPIGATS